MSSTESNNILNMIIAILAILVTLMIVTVNETKNKIEEKLNELRKFDNKLSDLENNAINNIKFHQSILKWEASFIRLHKKEEKLSNVKKNKLSNVKKNKLSKDKYYIEDMYKISRTLYVLYDHLTPKLAIENELKTIKSMSLENHIKKELSSMFVNIRANTESGLFKAVKDRDINSLLDNILKDFNKCN